MKEDDLVVFTNITRIGDLSEEASPHTAEMMTIKIALKEFTKQKTKVGWYIQTHQTQYSPFNTKKT